MEIGRETTDLDFLLTSIAASKDEIKEAIEEIIDVGIGDVVIPTTPERSLDVVLTYSIEYVLFKWVTFR